MRDCKAVNGAIGEQGSLQKWKDLSCKGSLAEAGRTTLKWTCEAATVTAGELRRSPSQSAFWRDSLQNLLGFQRAQGRVLPF